MMESIFVWVFSSVFILLGVLAVTEYFKARRRIADSERWHRTAGQLESIKVIEKRRRKNGARLTRYRVEFSFAYEANGRMHRGTNKNIWLSGRVIEHHLEEDAQAAMEQWQAAGKLPVYFNPENPAECCIEREKKSAANGILIIAFGMFTFGFGFLGIYHESFLLSLFARI